MNGARSAPLCGRRDCIVCSVCIRREQEQRNLRRFGQVDFPGGHRGEWTNESEGK